MTAARARTAGPAVTAGDGYPASYYAATAHPAPPRPALSGETRADVCVVGAGYTGLSAALSLAERGYSVRVLEAAKAGWGASGRNGGQLVNGLNAGLDKIERAHGAAAATGVGQLVMEGGRLIRERIARWRIDCDLQSGNLFTAFSAAQMRGFAAKQALWRRHGHDSFELLDKEDVRRHVGTDAYVGGLLDTAGGHLHPLNLALGQAAAIEALGGVIHEGSRVTGLEDAGPRRRVRTDGGAVCADAVLLCGNAYLGGVVPELADRILPVATHIMATEPLSAAQASAALPTNLCVEDARYILDYYRLSPDRRLLWGGGSVYGGRTPDRIEARLRPGLARIFPDLADLRAEYVWSGWFALSFSRIPQLGRLRDGVYFAHGYSGHGVVGAHLFGAILAEAVAGEMTRFDLFARLPHIPFPGGRALRVPYSVLGAWWYGLRDRLGV